MKVLVLTDYNHFDYTDVPEPEVGPRDVLIRVRASGICGSDVHGMDGSSGRRPLRSSWATTSGEVARTGPGDQVAGRRPGHLRFDDLLRNL